MKLSEQSCCTQCFQAKTPYLLPAFSLPLTYAVFCVLYNSIAAVCDDRSTHRGSLTSRAAARSYLEKKGTFPFILFLFFSISPNVALLKSFLERSRYNLQVLFRTSAQWRHAVQQCVLEVPFSGHILRLSLSAKSLLVGILKLFLLPCLAALKFLSAYHMPCNSLLCLVC